MPVPLRSPGAPTAPPFRSAWRFGWGFRLSSSVLTLPGADLLLRPTPPPPPPATLPRQSMSPLDADSCDMPQPPGHIHGPMKSAPHATLGPDAAFGRMVESPRGGLYDQAQAHALYTPLFWGRSHSIPQVVVLDVQPLVQSSFWARK